MNDKGWIELEPEESLENFWKYISSIVVISNTSPARATRIPSESDSIFRLKYNPFTDKYKIIEFNKLFYIDPFWKTYTKKSSLSVGISFKDENLLNIDNIDSLCLSGNKCWIKFDSKDIKNI